MFQDKLICILKRTICSDEECNEYKEKVSSEMELSELLEDLGKVIEATSRLKKKKIIVDIILSWRTNFSIFKLNRHGRDRPLKMIC